MKGGDSVGTDDVVIACSLYISFLCSLLTPSYCHHHIDTTWTTPCYHNSHIFPLSLPPLPSLFSELDMYGTTQSKPLLIVYFLPLQKYTLPLGPWAKSFRRGGTTMKLLILFLSGMKFSRLDENALMPLRGYFIMGTISICAVVIKTDSNI